MNSRIKQGLCWALTALQVTSEAEKHETVTQVNAETNPRKTFVNVQASMNVDYRKDAENIRTVLSKKAVADHKDDDRENIRPVFSRKEVSDHCDCDSCWMVINNKVYDVTRFLRLHPGGYDIMLEYGGHDATSAFIDKGHSLEAYNMLSEYRIGEVIKADWLPEKNFT